LTKLVYADQLKALLEVMSGQSKTKDDVFEAYSRLKSLEYGAYLSVGAYLHIVQGDRMLHNSFYKDSMLDNFGFVMETLFEEDGMSMMGFSRVSKYVVRMCDAYNLINGQGNKRIEKLEILAKQINKARTTHTLNERLVCKLYNFVQDKEVQCLQLVGKSDKDKWSFAKSLFQEFESIFS
jgi:hypothetical protein